MYMGAPGMHSNVRWNTAWLIGPSSLEHSWNEGAADSAVPFPDPVAKKNPPNDSIQELELAT